MTAALTNTQSINTLYPQAGIDNSSQGFRDNFNHIQLALSSIDTYMDALAGTTLNVNASVITGTQLVSALTNLELGTSTVFNIGQLSDIVIIGKNPDGSSAAGSVGFFNDGSATPFQNFSVLTYNEAQAIISETFSSNLILTAGDNSDAYTNGTLVVEGGVGIGKSLHVGGDINVDGNLIIGGNLINTSSNVTFNGITITGNLTLKDSNNDSSPSIILNTTSFINYFSASDNITVSSATVVNSNLVTGYQVLPTGLIMMWGTTPVSYTHLTLPTILRV